MNEDFKKLEERVNTYNLPLDVNTVHQVCMDYINIYPDTTYNERFYLYILNNIGSVLTTINEDIGEILGWLKVKKIDNMICYEFETPEDYLAWINNRHIFYMHEELSLTDIRLLNFVELSCIDFISNDFSYKEDHKYVITHNDYPDIQNIKKVDDIPFFKILADAFKNNFNFIYENK